MVVLLHGLMTDHRVWKPVIDALGRRYRFVSLEAPGHGGSPTLTSSYSLEQEADVLVETLDQIGIGFPVAWVGHSMGGMKAMRVALRHPIAVSQLVLISTQPYTEPERTARPYWAMVEAAKSWGISADLAEVIGRLNFHRSFLPTDGGKLWLEHFTHLKADDIREACSSVFDRGDVSDSLSTIAVPTLVLHGENDVPIRLPVTRDWVRMLPNAELLEIADCGHTPHFERPDVVAPAIDRFLQRVAPGQHATKQIR
ncbi:alpha/beta hydrolase [Streptomyces sp. NPDC057889]|uniref:alpha/beta hydrolase n=1 Tax=unclassified Streptomyces TaxID=2593676 RepID=UPI0036A1F309